jgi:hypothetical protein
MYKVKLIVRGFPVYLQFIDEEDNPIWVKDEDEAFVYRTLREARVIAKKYDATAFDITEDTLIRSRRI